MSNTEFKIAVTEAEKEKISASCAIWHIPQGSSTRECICFVNEPCVNYMTGQSK